MLMTVVLLFITEVAQASVTLGKIFLLILYVLMLYFTCFVSGMHGEVPWNTEGHAWGCNQWQTY